MDLFAPSMQSAAGDLAERWARLPQGSLVDAVQEMAELTAEVIAQAVFRRKLGPEAARSIVTGFIRYQVLIDSLNLGYYLGADNGWPIFRGPRLRRALRQIHDVIDGMIAAQFEQSGDEVSMVGILRRRQERNPELGLDLNALRSEAATMFMAGYEGTSATLTWVWYLLANAPWIETEVHRELDDVLGGRTPEVADMPALKWCRAVIEETLRLYPPVPILPRQAKDADRVGDIDVEPGALVIVVPWLLHRARDLWSKPHDFLPERFLSQQRPAPYTYIPFGTGPRVCPGMSFGMTESVICLAILAQRFRVRVAKGYRVEPHSRLSLRPRGGLPIYIEARTH
jgi:cytochrome P450